ncbi:hypothetical protein Nepgr_006812 [Nepenthes gracilis]|uniref:Uncharacterized protein n=1 Tax=Nepenthes gracilis TaxID=150966 RepID=A0AAD3S5Q2_NEPGR|nr:hypothetical protein Nepgr_006812 [Nepenthes gracilis]
MDSMEPPRKVIAALASRAAFLHHQQEGFPSKQSSLLEVRNHIPSKTKKADDQPNRGNLHQSNLHQQFQHQLLSIEGSTKTILSKISQT